MCTYFSIVYRVQRDKWLNTHEKINTTKERKKKNKQKNTMEGDALIQIAAGQGGKENKSCTALFHSCALDGVV